MVHEKVHFSNGNYETRSSKLPNEKALNVQLYLKGATAIYVFQPLAARLPRELVAKS